MLHKNRIAQKNRPPGTDSLHAVLWKFSRPDDDANPTSRAPRSPPSTSCRFFSGTRSCALRPPGPPRYTLGSGWKPAITGLRYAAIAAHPPFHAVFFSIIYNRVEGGG